MSMSVITMKRSGKLKRVSWAPDRNLCQVRVFRSDCCPEESYEVQDYLEAQVPNDLDSNLLPPGFGSGGMVPLWKGKPQSIPMIKWKSPPKFIMCGEWLVVAGEESQEVGTQKLREMRVLEAFYPHISAIPPSPSDAPNMEETYPDDRRTPVVPLTPIEEEEPAYSSADSVMEAKAYVQADLAMPSRTYLQSDLSIPTNPATLQPPDFVPMHSTACATQQNMPKVNPLPTEKPALKPSKEADVASTASSAALAALLKGKEPDSLIDTDLLIKILSDQQMVEKLLKETISPAQTLSTTMPLHQTRIPPGPLPSPATGLSFSAGLANGKSVANPNRIQSEILTMPQTLQNISASWTNPASNCGLEPTRSFSTMMPDAAFSSTIKVQPTPNILQTHHKIGVVNPSAVTAPPPIKDINYYKSLVKLHGGENQDSQEKPLAQYGQHGHFQDTKKDTGLKHNLKSKNMESKFQKPCIYFKSSKGCRNGLNCPFKHDLTSQLQVDVPEVHQSAKRMKFS